MSEQSPQEAHTEIPPVLPSVDDSQPTEEGGPIARTGFNYQDEIAVSFFIEMLEDSQLLKVHCETHDDILLVRSHGEAAIRTAEFVQVKGAETDKLWSIADLCQRKNAKAGTSIYEASLARDKHAEWSRFRIVTLRPVVSALEVLTRPIGTVGREPECQQIADLKSEIEQRFSGLKSPKSNGAEFWLNNCFWDQRHDESAVRKDNLVRLMRFSCREGRPLLLEPAELLLDELRKWAKTAGAAKWVPDRDKKIILREQIREWWEKRTGELEAGAATASGGKLTGKMQAAGLPEDMIQLAVDIRRGYAANSRSPRYLDSREVANLQDRAKSEVASLRARLISGQLDLDGAAFHALCLERMDAVNAERLPGADDRSAFLKGCLYDIADRCMLQFVRPV